MTTPLELLIRVGLGKKASEARIALRELPASDVMPAVLEAVADARPKVRSAGYSFGASTPELCALFPFDRLIGGATDPDAGVRLSVVLALNVGFGPKNELVYQSRSKQLKPVFTRLQADSDKRVATQAAVVAKRYGL